MQFIKQFIQVSNKEPCLLLNSKEYFVTLIRQNKKLTIMNNESVENFEILKIVEESDIENNGDCLDAVKSVYLVWDDGEFSTRETGKLFNIFLKNVHNDWEFICFSPTSVLRLDNWVKDLEVKKCELKIEQHCF